MKKKLSAVLATVLLALGIGVVGASSASAHTIDGCRGSYTANNYRNQVVKQTTTNAGSFPNSYWIRRDWKVTYLPTGAVHTHQTYSHCYVVL